MKLFNFAAHGIRYQEIAEWICYIGLVDMGEFFDVRSCFAHNEDEAKTIMGAFGGEMFQVFPLSEALEILQKNIDNPHVEEALNKALLHSKPGPVV